MWTTRPSSETRLNARRASLAGSEYLRETRAAVLGMPAVNLIEAVKVQQFLLDCGAKGILSSPDNVVRYLDEQGVEREEVHMAPHSGTVLCEACPCGSVLPCIRVEGRREDILHFAHRTCFTRDDRKIEFAAILAG